MIFHGAWNKLESVTVTFAEYFRMSVACFEDNYTWISANTPRFIINESTNVIVPIKNFWERKAEQWFEK